mmetsp:Transcript_13393/g.14385  ORF Transcript_13393/g.14385 Transcript_13393/m.14385 type:complete len:83 (+) Transcript_13393:464-712(+)
MITNNNNKRRRPPPRHIVYTAFGIVYSHTKKSVQLLQTQLERLTISQTTTTGDESENDDNNNNVSIIWSLPESQQLFLHHPL